MGVPRPHPQEHPVNVIDLLTEDHAEVDALFDRVSRSDDPDTIE